LLSSATELELPHPRAFERRFVLEPWHEIEPDALLLTHGKISELLAQLS
jgi:2-amino-4-hydroxy-6-hydroxymethyldihydropteridine diphosphokinase